MLPNSSDTFVAAVSIGLLDPVIWGHGSSHENWRQTGFYGRQKEISTWERIIYHLKYVTQLSIR